MKAVCPKSKDHKRFSTGVIEYHDWEVDEEGNFIKDLGSEQSEKPLADSLWTCRECGAEANVSLQQ